MPLEFDLRLGTARKYFPFSKMIKGFSAIVGVFGIFTVPVLPVS